MRLRAACAGILTTTLVMAPGVRATDCTRQAVGPQIPISDPGGVGMYPDGTNVRPFDHEQRGVALAAAIKASPGPHVFTAIGMSVTKNEMQGLRNAAKTVPHNPAVVVVNCAQNGATAEEWSNWPGGPWAGCDSMLANAGYNRFQVKVVLVKLTRQKPNYGLDFFKSELTREWRQTMLNAAAHFPNLTMTYHTGRSFGGYDDQYNNGEPYAYATGEVAKQIVADSINDPTLTWADWSIDQWADGASARVRDGFKWVCDPNPYRFKNGEWIPTYKYSDVGSDGVHQTALGVQKQVTKLLAWLAEDATTLWWR